MGIVRHAEKAPTNILYKVDDMTAAPMDVRQWVDTDVSVAFAVNGLLQQLLRAGGREKL